GEQALVRLPQPVNRFPDFVRVVVERLRATVPFMGKVRMAQTLARAGLHLGATTVRRMMARRERPAPQPESACGELGRKRKKERSEEHTSELQSRGHLVCRLLLEKKKKTIKE